MKKSQLSISILVASYGLVACAPPQFKTTAVPAKEYTQRIRQQYAGANQPYSGSSERPGEIRSVASMIEAEGRDSARARLRFASDTQAVEPELNQVAAEEQGYTVQRSSMQDKRDYVGPLILGNPGVTASLWQESRSSNDLFHDNRAWQPMDLITIVVSEQAEGKNNANTEVKSKSTVEAAIDNLLGFDNDIKETFEGISTGTVDKSSMIKASSQNNFKGEGKTDRKGSLKGKISAMVAEVLPSGVLRIEGEKIISVNSEQQVMVISGLVRPRDINSENEVDSSKIAQLRVDYFGEGTVGEAQHGGWLGRILRRVWPF